MDAEPNTVEEAVSLVRSYLPVEVVDQDENGFFLVDEDNYDLTIGYAALAPGRDRLGWGGWIVETVIDPDSSSQGYKVSGLHLMPMIIDLHERWMASRVVDEE